MLFWLTYECEGCGLLVTHKTELPTENSTVALRHDDARIECASEDCDYDTNRPFMAVPVLAEDSI